MSYHSNILIIYAGHKYRPRVYLGTCCNWSENGRLEAHGKVEGEDEGREVDAD